MALHYVPVVDTATSTTPLTTAAAGPDDEGEEDGDGRFRLELAFPTFGGVGKGHAKKRRDVVRCVLCGDGWLVTVRSSRG